MLGRIAGLLAVLLLSARLCAADAADDGYFPLSKGLTWKYRVTAKTDEVADRPFFQTVEVGEAVKIEGTVLWPAGGDYYVQKNDGIYLAARKTGERLTPVDPPRKVLPLEPRTGDTWKLAGGDETGQYACLGARAIQTEAGKFDTQCVLCSSSVGEDRQRTTYRFYARGVGLVRETISEDVKRTDGSKTHYEYGRDLVAFFGPDTSEKPPANTGKPIGAEQVRGQLLDSTGLPVAQASLTLRRISPDETIALQTDVQGRFSRANLDPEGVYVLVVQITGFQKQQVPLTSADGSAVSVEVKLRPVMAAPASRPATMPAMGSRAVPAGKHGRDARATGEGHGHEYMHMPPDRDRATIGTIAARSPHPSPLPEYRAREQEADRETRRVQFIAPAPPHQDRPAIGLVAARSPSPLPEYRAREQEAGTLVCRVQFIAPTYGGAEAEHGRDARATGVRPLYLSAGTDTAPADPKSLVEQGRELAKRGDHDEAIAAYRKALTLDTKLHLAHALMAVSYVSLGRIESAQREIELALAAAPDEYLYNEVGGQVLVRQGKLAEGKALYDKALKLSPKNAGDIWADYAAALASRNDPSLNAQIENALKSAASADPPSLDALFALGQSLAAAGKQEGRPYLQKYVDLATKLPEDQRDPQKIKLSKRMIQALEAIR